MHFQIRSRNSKSKIKGNGRSVRNKTKQKLMVVAKRINFKINSMECFQVKGTSNQKFKFKNNDNLENPKIYNQSRKFPSR